MGRWFVNPRHRRRHFVRGHLARHGRRRVRVAAHWSNPIIRNPFVRGISMFNPHRRRHHRRHHYRHNPIIRNPGGVMSGVTHAIRDPLGLIAQGGVGTASAFLTISVSNTLQGMIGLFVGQNIVDKLVRGVVRAGVGSLLYGLFRSFAPRQANAALVGVAIGAGGGFLFDVLGTRLVVGVGDTAQTPGMLFAGVGNLGNLFGGAAAPAVAGYGAYVRPMGAYVRPMGRVGYRGMDGIYGPGSMNALAGAGADSIYG